MNRGCLRPSLMQEVAGPLDLVGRSVDNQEKCVVLHLGLYCKMLSFGIPMLYRPAPRALSLVRNCARGCAS